MRILMVSTELWPVVKVGGLADMVGSLSGALRGLGHDVRCMLPHYGRLDGALPADTRVVGQQRIPVTVNGTPTPVVLRSVESERLPAPLTLVDHELFRRDGVYDDPSTRSGYPDNGLRWSVFCRAVHASIGTNGWTPEIVHGHDHQVGPLIGLLRWAHDTDKSRCPATVFTLHNLGYQGIEPPDWIINSGLPPELDYPMGPLEFHGEVNLLKIGIQAADRLTTVSPRYAREICASKEFGEGLQADLSAREDRLTGILNGIDTETWNPETDPHLPFRYSARNPANKSRNRTALRKEVGLEPCSKPKPLLGMVSRLTSQKGLGLLMAVLDQVIASGAQMVVLGEGEERLESSLEEFTGRLNGSLAVRIGYDEALAHRIEAGSDIFLMPSRYEPCGLNQMYSLRYGTVPVARAVGGLADTVVDLDEQPGRANGFLFRLFEPVELFKTVHRGVRAWRNRKLWRELMARGMEADFSWNRSARAYLDVYQQALRDADGN